MNKIQINTTTLDKIKIGQDAIIASVNCKDKALRSHILNMGLTPNVEVTLIKTAPITHQKVCLPT